MKNFNSMLALVKEYIIDLWEVKRLNYMLYPALGWGSEGCHCGWGAEKR